MKITYGTIWKLAALLALSAICALLYLKFLRPESGLLGSKASPPAAVGLNFVKLSALVDAQSGTIFSPLEEHTPPLPRQEVTSLRQGFVKAAQQAVPRSQAAYRVAIQLCDALLIAMQERERSLASLADTRSKPHAVAVSANPKKEAEQKQKFFESSIAQHWADDAKTYRAQILTLRARLQNEERQVDSGPVSKTLAPQAENMIVLQHATPVRLKYGTTTLPAGLTLRVLGRTPTSVTVEYSGEQVVVPLP